MNPGTKFKAIHRKTHKPAFQSRLNPNGLVLTCDSFEDGLIICEEETCPAKGGKKVINIFTRFFDIRFES